AYIDKSPTPVIRANYIARAVEVPTGSHVVEFRFEPPVNTLYISLLGILTSLGLAAYVMFTGKKPSTDNAVQISTIEKKPDPTPLETNTPTPKKKKQGGEKKK
ncbi:hypothetical protein N9B94_03755, partial [Verrucomicrobia bacterium]|nr:hypothetical protein [Verrucomicrobiota bacterium]